MLTELVQLEAVGSVLRVTVGGVVAVLATCALHSHEWTVSLWHYWTPLGVIAAPTA